MPRYDNGQYGSLSEPFGIGSIMDFNQYTCVKPMWSMVPTVNQNLANPMHVTEQQTHQYFLFYRIYCKLNKYYFSNNMSQNRSMHWKCSINILRAYIYIYVCLWKKPLTINTCYVIYIYIYIYIYIWSSVVVYCFSRIIVLQRVHKVIEASVVVACFLQNDSENNRYKKALLVNLDLFLLTKLPTMHQIGCSLEGSYIEIQLRKHTLGRINGKVIGTVFVIGKVIGGESDCIE